ncbi:MAG: general secretion pathway protein GspK [Blastochloris sp.]|nr:general secretion pathway protein GspK [Blastochloris sp.]
MRASRPRRSRAGGARDGFIIVAVLWILAALATLASVASVFVARSSVTLSTNDVALQSEMLVLAAVELAGYRLSSPTESERPRYGQFRFRLAGAEVTVEFLSEAARVDLNAAPKEMIAGLFMVLGAKRDDAGYYADRVTGWRTKPKADADGAAEDSLYRAAGLPYGPRGAPFDHCDELRLVLGLPPALVERIMPLVTIYSGLPEVNVLDAPPEVIAALPDMSPGRLNAFLQERVSGPDDPEFVARALGDKQAGATTKASLAYRVRTRVFFPNRQVKTVDVVILLTSSGKGVLYQVLSWQDDIGPAAGWLRRLDNKP